MSGDDIEECSAERSLSNSSLLEEGRRGHGPRQVRLGDGVVFFESLVNTRGGLCLYSTGRAVQQKEQHTRRCSRRTPHTERTHLAIPPTSPERLLRSVATRAES